MIRPPRLLLLAYLGLAMTVGAQSPPDELPPPVDQVRFLPDTSGQDIGLPLGATAAYAVGRSLLQQGDTERALLYLNRAYQLAPSAWSIALAFAQGLQEGGYLVDAAEVYGDLLAQHPDSLAQRHQHAVLLAHIGQPRQSLAEIAELRRRGMVSPELVKLEADQLARLDRVDDAIAVYREAGRRDPEHSEDYYLAAGALMQRLDRFDDMAALLREGLGLRPTSRALRLSLLRYLVHQGKLRRAVNEAAAGDAARRDAGVSGQPDCSLDLAEIFARQGMVTAAVEVLDEVLASWGRDAAIETSLARYRLALGQPDAAADGLERLINRWPALAEPRYLWGRALEMLGEVEAARQQLSTAVDLAPEHSTYRIALLRLLVVHLGDELAAAPEGPPFGGLRQEAFEHAVRAASALAPGDNDGHLILGYAFRQLGELARACQHFHLAGEVAETRVLARMELSFCLQDSGREEEAIAVLRALQAEYPDDPELANNLGYFLAEAGEDLAFAEQLVRQALRSDPGNGAYLDSLGWVLFRRGDYAEAFDWLVEAANARPEDPTILEHLAHTLLKMGKPGEAIDLLRRALERGGDRERLEALIAEVEDDR